MPALSQEVQLDGIVISGEKIDRSYLDTTTSVGVVTSDDIEDYSVTDVFDSFSRLANVRQFPRNGGNNAFQIRGLNADGISEVSNSIPLISVVIDGATQNREGIRRGIRSTWDLEQIEVLRGPQSGLHGRAALAGTVVIESKDPTYHWESAFKGTLGTYDRKGGAFMLSGPLIANQLAIRVSGEARKEIKDITFDDPGNELLAEDQFRNFRGKILFEPKAVAGLRALFTFNHAFDQPGSNTVTGPDFYAREFSGASSYSEFRKITVNNYVANVSYAFSNAFKFRSISSFIKTDLNISSVPTSTVYDRTDNRIGDDFTQDLRLEINDKKGSGWSGVIGLFYGHFKEDTDSSIYYDLGAGFLVPIQVGTLGGETKTAAIYSDLRYNFYGPWSLIGGLRYQKDDVRNYSNIESDFLGDTIYDHQAEFSVWLPKYGLAYEIDPTQTISLTGRRGYRQGFTENIIATAETNAVDPEFVWTYELAYRKVTLNKRLSFGVNVFYNDYTNQQVSVVNPDYPPFVNTLNVASSYSYGAEIESKFDFGNGLKVFGSIGLLKTRIKELDDDDACGSSGGSCAGNEFPEAPNLTFSFGGLYKHHTGWFIAADTSYTSSYYSTGDINNLSALKVDDHFLVNMKVGYQTAKFTASAYVKNAFDEQYLTGINSSTTQASIGDGRTFGIEVLTKF